MCIRDRTDIAKIASELGVDAVMTGRLTKRGDNLNITVELVDARTNKSLWGEQYERKLSELLTTQREIVTEIEVEIPALAPEPGSSAETLALRLAQANRTVAVPYASEAGQFQMHGVPTVLCGPGSIEQAHKVDEFLATDQLGQCDKFLRQLARALEARPPSAQAVPDGKRRWSSSPAPSRSGDPRQSAGQSLPFPATCPRNEALRSE